MDKSRLSPCRTCGKEISTNLAIRELYSHGSVGVGCPHCGEREPHLTEQELKLGAYQQEAQRKFDEGNNEANRRVLGLWDLLKWGGIILVGYMVLRVFI